MMLSPTEQPFEKTRKTPWGQEVGIDATLAGWRGDARLWSSVTCDTALPARSASVEQLPADLHPGLRKALGARGITCLYTHQEQALALARAGSDVVIATPTSSGKSLCYNLPVLDRLAGEPSACALYLFPTKALSRDQEAALRTLMKEAGVGRPTVTYDGDTPGDARRVARDRSSIVLTNPDMLHTGILPHHAGWARLFSHLRFVILDELHTYRGVPGSHLANVLRRLERVARFHGSVPTFIMASATIGNPREHAERILGRAVALVDEDGSPAGERRVLVYNPPVVNEELGIRASYIKSAVRLAADLVRAAVPTLVFGQSRNTVEVMLKYLRERLAAHHIDTSTIHGYRGGYLPAARRRIEEGLRSGDIRCVVATSALELGIDIGMLDAVVCAGYPGNVAALWQRFGRAGRRGELSLAVLVSSSAPLDQFFAQNPEALLGAPIEHARIDPDNIEILVPHLECAAFELPFCEGECFRDVPSVTVGQALGYLSDHRVLHPATDGAGRTVYHWSSDSYPANHVSLRNIGWDNVVIIDVDRQRAIGELDWRASHTMLHEQAIYQHEAEQYQVERLDLENHKAFVRRVNPDYFTTAMTYTQVSVIHEDETAELRCGRTRFLLAGVGDVSVVEKVVGYKKIKFHTHENVGYGEVRLPDMQMHTTAFWVTAPESVMRALDAPRPVIVDVLRGLSHAMHTTAAVGLMIDPRDLGCSLGDGADGCQPAQKQVGGNLFAPTIFLFDHVPGGVGLATRLYDERQAVLERTRGLITACPCEQGCPACIGPQTTAMPDPNDDPPGRKSLAIALLEVVGVRLPTA
jgi:DEAD/DEAH box helicase domain-containing protein